MSYQNFIPTIWAEEIQRDLERICVFAENCNRQYEGDVKKMGDTVRILGVGKPTITTTQNKEIVLSTPEIVEDTSISMPIKQISYFNYRVDDIDKQQAVGGVMEALSKETSEGLAAEMDKHIADMAKEKQAKLLEPSAIQITKDNVLNVIDSALQKLWENNVTPSTKVTMTVPPRFYFILKQAYQELDTDNSKILENGKVGKYGNVEVKLSNQVATANDGATDLIQVKTDRAIAFVNPMYKIEPFRPESLFADAVKGFTLYQAKIVRPKEMIILNAAY